MAIIKRKHNIKKLKIPVVIKRNRMFTLLKKSIIPLIAIYLVLLAYQGIKLIFVKSPYFEISKIDIMPETYSANLDKSEILRPLKEKNIFTVDIKNTARAIHADYPELRKVVVKRVMPDILQVVIVPRIPVALVKDFKYFPVDGEAVILSPQSEAEEGLPVITGISFWSRPKKGEVLRSNRIDWALALLKGIDESKVLTGYRLERIDVSNIRNIAFYLDNGLEVKIGHGSLREKIKKLSTLLNDPKVDINNLEYVDLRFKDAVLGPR